MRFLLPLALVSCATTIDVERTITPKEAEQSKLPPVAIARGNETIPLPEGATIASGQVRLSRTTMYTHKLGDSDVIETDDEGSIIAVRTASGERIEFKPKTAVSPEGSDYVKGELASSETGKTMALERNDRIVVKGTLSPGDEVPGGGLVVLRRSTGALVVGSFSFALAYIPAAIAGAVSNEDRALLAPIGGPWANLVTRPACTTPPSPEAGTAPCIPDTLARFGSVMSGIFQSLGVVFLTIGIPAKAVIEEPQQQEKPSVSIVPLPGGIGLSGRF
jgi:hypothetical protein